MARQGRNERLQEFADRYRMMEQRITCQSDDPVVQGVHRKNAERVLLASYISGIVGVPGKQVRYASPISMDQAIRIAVSVEEAERQEKFNTFYARNENRTDSDSSNSRHAAHIGKASQALAGARKFRRLQVGQALETRRISPPYAAMNAKA
jgi:hypothetical protein